MATQGLPAPEFLRKILRYDPRTGKLFWQRRPVDLFQNGGHSAQHNCDKWNARYADKEAFVALTGWGYLQGAVNGQLLKAHRVIWAMVHDEWPAEQIDHINGVRTDNRLANLRSVSHLENGRNQRTPARNTSGVVGVTWHKGAGKWTARIKVGSKHHYLGLFDRFEDAVAARAEASARFGFHENHGRA